MNIKHTILMITYNQEDFIREALECLFRQGVLPYEVFICDDFSTDKTRSIILEYKNKYPDIIKPIFHKKNLGINQNQNYMIDNVKVNGDVISFLAGDDLYKDNMLITFDNFINKNSLDLEEGKFILTTNVLKIREDSSILSEINHYKLRNKDYLKFHIRMKVGSRYTGISRKLFDTMTYWKENLGLWADYLHAFDLFIQCDNFYFINETFPIYRSGSGVTNTLKKENSFYPKRATYYLIKRYQCYEIDDIYDFMAIENIMKYEWRIK